LGKIECIDYLRDKLTPEEFTGFCIGNVLKYVSRWRKKDGLQDLEKAQVYLGWAIENETSRRTVIVQEKCDIVKAGDANSLTL
jgi:hypothetical protein